jgi:hypothetical protein
MPAVPLVLHATLLYLPVCVCCMADFLVQQPTQALVPPGPAAADDQAAEAGASECLFAAAQPAAAGNCLFSA